MITPKCQKCGYEWETNSEMIKVSCPSCGNKVKIKEIEHCEWYMHKDCPETCAYAEDIRGIGIGAMCNNNLIKRIRNIENEKIETNNM